jgi:predicted dehydrogenase
MPVKTLILASVITATLAVIACGRSGTSQVRLMTLDPGHFHAALVQKSMYPQVDPVVHVYAPAGADLDQHLKRIEGFNTRAEKPTAWQEQLHISPDFLERMLAERPGNVVVTSGNNQRKTEYIKRCVDAGLHVLADKPMAIDPPGFTTLREAFASAKRNDAMLFDIMTERFEITNILQRELSQRPELFGTLQPGTPDHPAIIKESVHHFLKEVAGKPLVRPTWFFDVKQQGEAIADVGTHLVDLVQWAAFPEVALDWTKDIKVLKARRWQTRITADDFKTITGSAFPETLKSSLGTDGALNMFANGETLYALRGIHARVAVMWNVKAPAGAKDTHYSIMRGTKADLVIRQGAEQNYVPSLFVEAAGSASPADTAAALRGAIAAIADRFPGLGVTPAGTGWQVTIPASYHNGHEAHFAQVTEKFLKCLAAGRLPDWEIPNMLAKYYTTTESYRLSHAAP